ncbi:MAG: hypothetical protein ABL898_07620 [Hyphomicrobiaceae bacterium]
MQTIADAIQTHEPINEIIRLPCDIDTEIIVGKYAEVISESGSRVGIIVHRKYDENDPFRDPLYPMIRFGIAKEMMHVFDSEQEKTRQHQVAVDLMESLLDKELWDGKRPDYFADKRAIYGAIELLVRFEIRVVMANGLIVTQARSTNDWSYVGKQFRVPDWVAAIAFNQHYIEYIKSHRESAKIVDHDFYVTCGN